MKQLPNLIDMGEIHKDITNTLFKKTSYRINIILGLILIFSVLLFIYFGINNNRSQNTLYIHDDYYVSQGDSSYEEESYNNNMMIDPTELALMS
jgi:low temperature requirement protein LtrA